MSTPRPSEIKLHRASHTLEVGFDNGERYTMSCEYLRTHSPSAEVQGHGPGQQVLVAGKRDVNIDAIEPVGNYGVLLRFSDGHATGIFSWSTLHDLGVNQQRNLEAYLEALEKNGLVRGPA